MNMRKVCVAWAVIVLVMVSAAFAQGPRHQDRTSQFACKCNISANGTIVNCSACIAMPNRLNMPTTRNMFMRDSMPMNRREIMMENMRMRFDSSFGVSPVQDSSRIFMCSPMPFMQPRRMGPPR